MMQTAVMGFSSFVTGLPPHLPERLVKKHLGLHCLDAQCYLGHGSGHSLTDGA